MLGKLIKYDFRSCWKKFWPVWTAVIIISFINGWSWNYCTKYSNYTFLPNVLPKLLLFAVAVAGIVIALIYVYNEFCHGLLGREGYLMFTLPVSEEELILSKLITALIMFVISGIVVVLGIIIMAFLGAPEYMSCRFTEVMKFIAASPDIFLIILFLIECFILVVTSAATFVFHIYTAVSVGHLIPKHRRITGVIVFILLCILSIFLLINLVVPLMRTAFHAGYSDLLWKNDLYSSMSALGVMIICEIIYSAIMMLVVRYILKRRLNLE